MSPVFCPIANPRLCVILAVCFTSGRYCFYKWLQVDNTVLSPQSGYELCPGIKEYLSDLYFKSVSGVSCLDSNACLLWHLPSNHCHPTGDPLQNVCVPCKLLQFQIDQLVNRNRLKHQHSIITHSRLYNQQGLKPWTDICSV